MPAVSALSALLHGIQGICDRRVGKHQGQKDASDVRYETLDDAPVRGLLTSLAQQARCTGISRVPVNINNLEYKDNSNIVATLDK